MTRSAPQYWKSSIPAIVMLCTMEIAFTCEALPPSAPGISVAGVTNQEQISHIVGEFQHQLNRLGSNSRIVACNHVTELKDVNVTRDYSYGADCIIENGNERISVMICDDNLVGKFTLSSSDKRVSGISRFIQNNCLPGG